MKAKTFENLIRKVVREEIDYALRREIKSLKEDLRDEINSPIVEQELPSSTISESSKDSLRKKIMGTNPILNKTIKPKTFISDNPTLNDLLNETAMGDTNLENPMSPVSMEGDFSTIGGIPTESAPQAVQEAVTRDYSSLMKAIDKKRNK